MPSPAACLSCLLAHGAPPPPRLLLPRAESRAQRDQTLSLAMTSRTPGHPAARLLLELLVTASLLHEAMAITVSSSRGGSFSAGRSFQRGGRTACHSPATLTACPFSVQCAANCQHCVKPGKCDPGGCSLGYGLTSSGTCAKVWGRFVGVVCAHRFTLDVSNCWGLAISFGTSSCLCCNQLPTMFACSVQQTVGIAQQLEPASAIGVLMAMAPPQNAHAQRCGVDLWVLCVLTGSFSLCQTVGGLPFPLQHHPTFVALNCLPCFRAVCGKLSALRQTRQVRSWWLFSWLWAHLEWHMRKGVG